MQLLRTFWLRCRLPALGIFISLLFAASPAPQLAQAMSALSTGRSSGPLQGLAGCAPCIAQVSPESNGSVTPDADGSVTISATAQLNENYTAFTMSIDKVDVDPGKVQITGDPKEPTISYHAVIPPGQHHAFVQVSDANGPEASYGWDFTVQAAPMPSPTKTTASTGPGGNGANDGSNTATNSGVFTPKVLSIILFSIAGVGLLVIVFIAGMWYAGNRSLRNTPRP